MPLSAPVVAPCPCSRGRCAKTSPIRPRWLGVLRETRPDVVIVSTVDHYHREDIIRVLHTGCDAITEKPMTIDAEKCRAVLAAERMTGRWVTVTFNSRLKPYNTRIKELLSAGAIGRVLAVELECFLDKRHGADYFRRWHRRKENSGGLLVHEGSHLFDLVNWWLADQPRDVFAMGDRRVYGPTRAARGERCSTCPYAASCEFYVDLAADSEMQALYFQAEREDGYQRDGCVFSPDIDIEDTVSAMVRYVGGALMTYSLVTYAPYEGWRLSLTGTGGRLEAHELQSGPGAETPSQTIRLVRSDPRAGTHVVEEIEVPRPRGELAVATNVCGTTCSPALRRPIRSA